jgi:ribulose-phosphate 3-epimerase
MNERPILLSASLACVDWLHVERDLCALEQAGVDMLHIDVMDGAFVPNFALNADLMRVVRQVSALPMDVHLMIEQPERYVERFVAAGADFLVVHQEATSHLQRVLAQVRALGSRAGVALNPATSLQTLDYVWEDVDLLLVMTVNPGFVGQKLVPATLRKIAEARALIQSRGLAVDIQVDGNVSPDNAAAMVRAGANVLVGGTSSIFCRDLSIAEGVARLRCAAGSARDGE